MAGLRPRHFGCGCARGPRAAGRGVSEMVPRSGPEGRTGHAGPVGTPRMTFDIPFVLALTLAALVLFALGPMAAHFPKRPRRAQLRSAFSDPAGLGAQPASRGRAG